MRVGVLTLYYNSKNYGGLLQSYAIVEFLNKNCFEAEQICYDISVSSKENDSFQKKRRAQLLFSSGLRILLSKIKNYLSYIVHRSNDDYSTHLELQNQKFKAFESFVPHSDIVYNTYTISNAEQYYEAFITGSDQVWNPGLLMHSAYYLKFVSQKKKRIPFAVSMGKSRLTTIEKKAFLSNITELPDISVRERSLNDLIRSISSNNCQIVLDPTLLLRYEDWKKIENNSRIPEKKYIFCYFLGDCKWQRECVRKFAEENNLSIIDVPFIMSHYRPSDEILSAALHLELDPREFICFIANAEYVFTDSFHAVAFSVNFHKDFFAFDRDGISGKNSINSRIVDFLSMLSLEDRRITSSSYHLSTTKIDYAKTEKLLQSKIEETKTWLIAQLNGR